MFFYIPFLCRTSFLVPTLPYLELQITGYALRLFHFFQKIPKTQRTAENHSIASPRPCAFLVIQFEQLLISCLSLPQTRHRPLHLPPVFHFRPHAIPILHLTGPAAEPVLGHTSSPPTYATLQSVPEFSPQ